MATLTISTTGWGTRPYGGGDTPECHKVEDISYSRLCGSTDFSGGPASDRNIAVVKLETKDALDIAYDLLYQAIDAGEIAGFSIEHPDER